MPVSARNIAFAAALAGLLVATSAIAAALWLGFTAWKLASANRGIVAVILLLVGSILGVIVFLLGSKPMSISEQRDVAKVYHSLHRAETSLRVIRLGRGVVGLVCAGLVLFWMAEGLAILRITEFLIPSSIIAATAALLYLPWLRRGERRLDEQRAAILRHLKDLKGNLL
jgi:hypothetical protein